MSEKQSKLAAGQIQFHQWCQPPLEPADYTVKVTQTVGELADDPTSQGSYSKTFDFSVAGPRFTLNPSEVYSVYPPKGQIGDFANSLPHVVFTRRTLPWERAIIPGPREESDTRPWMALLVFSAADFPKKKFPENEACTVEDLIQSNADSKFVGPKLKLEAYESSKDLCNTMQLPWDVFQRVAPGLKDLEYLAHVREVNTGDKETLSLLADGWFSVVLANRFPQPQPAETAPPLAVENRAYLVSLEGLEDYLPGSAKPAANKANKPVRLVVLSSWNFHCCEAFAFKASMKKLRVELLRVPWQGNQAPSDGTAERQVYDAYRMGYTALNHSTRLGEKAVSWYRGPLVPLELSKETKYGFRPAPDAALRYSPLDGMMDVSYAAAFQLGRLLALQDRHFATALYAYRNGVRRQINEVLAREQLLGKLPGSAGDAESEIMASYLKAMGSGSTQQDGEDNWATSASNGELFKRKSERGRLQLTTDFDLTIPQTVCRWLSRLMLLYRVPFTNLVADERMLPPDSIRFFYLDPGWLKCLLEGACSVGRSSARDELVDEYLRDKFLDFAIEQSLEVRTRPPKGDSDGSRPITSNSKGNPSVVTTPQPHGLRTHDMIVISGVSSSNADINSEHTVTRLSPKTFSVPVDARGQGGEGGSFVRSDNINVKQKPRRKPNWPLTGFLLRSPVVDGWQGLEMRAWTDSGESAKGSLAPLRIDRLAPDIMLCIFDGKVERIEVKQPPEGMHFGASASPSGVGLERFSLRRLKVSAEQKNQEVADQLPDSAAQKDQEVADQLPDSAESIPLRTKESRVVEVAQLAAKLEEKLNKLDARDAKAPFTSADFGVEMVESPGRVVFDVNVKLRQGAEK